MSALTLIADVAQGFEEGGAPRVVAKPMSEQKRDGMP